jgi:hypothetical protein
MAETNVKTLQTRIALKYDTYANWTDEAKGANLVLLKGEIGICAIGDTAETGNGQATTNPTVLFKVGDGVTPFKTLKWASALAADVYGWAKAETVVFNSDNERLEFKTGDEVVHYVELSHFAKASDVADHADRLTDIEAALGLDAGAGDESVSKQIAGILEQLGKIQGADTVDGSIAKALKDAKAYTDEKIGTAAVGTEGAEGYVAATGVRKEIADAKAAAVAAANAYTDAEVDKLEAADAALVKEDERLAGLIDAEQDAREAADLAINNKIGTVAEGQTVVGLIEAAQQAAADAQADVDALTAAGGQVTVNASAISQLQTDLAEEAEAREAADNALDVRLDKIETFFAGAYDENGEALNKALDTLVEIQDYLDGDGEAAGTLVDKVDKNATDIAALQATLAKDGDFEKRVAAIEASASDNADDIKSLQELTAGDYGEGTIKDAIDAAMAQANKGVEDAGKAQAAAEKAQGEVDALEGVVSTLRGEYDVTKALATTNEADISALEGRMDTAESDIDALQAIVNAEGGNSNAQLRADIEALEAIVVDGADGNVALGLEIDAVAAKVNNEETGLAATYAIAKQAATDVAAIEADYLRAADAYIFNCGSATEVVHVASEV